jgi:hypothetical protein
MVEPTLIVACVTLAVSLFSPVTQMIGRIKKSSCGACQVDIGTPPRERSVDNISKENKT